MQPVLEEVLGGLHALGERLPVERLVDPGAEEADHRARLGDRDVAERAPGGEHPAGRGVAQVDEVGQAGRLERRAGGADLDHADEGRGALLHARAARGGGREERQLLAPWPARTRARSAPRPREPIEPARKRNSPAMMATRRPRIVPSPVTMDSSVPALLRRGGELGGIRAVRGRGLHRVGVPALPAALVEDGVEQLEGAEPARLHAHRLVLLVEPGAHRLVVLAEHRAGRGAPRGRRHTRCRRSGSAARGSRWRRGPGGRCRAPGPANGSGPTRRRGRACAPRRRGPRSGRAW